MAQLTHEEALVRLQDETERLDIVNTLTFNTEDPLIKSEMITTWPNGDFVVATKWIPGAPAAALLDTFNLAIQLFAEDEAPEAVDA